MTDRPLSQHEGALFDAVQVILATLLDMGADRNVLRARLCAARDKAHGLGNSHGAATLEFLIQAVMPTPDAPEPATPPPRPTFRIV